MLWLSVLSLHMTRAYLRFQALLVTLLFWNWKEHAFTLHYPFSSKIQTIRNQSTLTNKTDLLYYIKCCNLWSCYMKKNYQKLIFIRYRTDIFKWYWQTLNKVYNIQEIYSIIYYTDRDIMLWEHSISRNDDKLLNGVGKIAEATRKTQIRCQISIKHSSYSHIHIPHITIFPWIIVWCSLHQKIHSISRLRQKEIT